jgi:hypothetical protein
LERWGEISPESHRDQPAGQGGVAPLSHTRLVRTSHLALKLVSAVLSHTDRIPDTCWLQVDVVGRIGRLNRWPASAGWVQPVH